MVEVKIILGSFHSEVAPHQEKKKPKIDKKRRRKGKKKKKKIGWRERGERQWRIRRGSATSPPLPARSKLLE